ncbi:hypothetical protein Tco_0351863 [Tanacetum coccineum]
MTSFEQSECIGCGQPCVGFYCYLCTCQQCGCSLTNGTCINCTYGDGKPITCWECENPLNGGFCLFCASRVENSSAYDSNSNSYNDSPQPQYETYSCELCRNDAHFGYDCPTQVPFVYNQDLCYNQNFDNNFPQTSPSFPQQYLCCENCGGPHANFQCQPMNQSFSNSNTSGFDQIQPPQYPVTQETSVEILQAKGDLMKSIQTFLKKFSRIPFGETPKILLLAWEKFGEIQYAQPEDIQDLLHKLLEDLKVISEKLVEYINSPSWNRPTFYDNDDDEYTIIYRSSKTITPDLPTVEPDNSLSMGDEHLSTIPETESDEVIKSSVENLALIPSESEGISDDTCDVPFCDNSSPFDVLKDHDEIFSNSNDDDTSSDDDDFEDIEYVEASPPDSDLVSLKEVNDVDQEKEEFDLENIFLIQDVILREKLLNINRLISNIESWNDNCHTPQNQTAAEW